MTYSDFAQKMLIGLYQETVSSRDEANLFAHDIADKYGLGRDPSWIKRVAQEWGADGLANVYNVPNDTAPARSFYHVEITGRGMRRIEEAYGSKDGVGQVLRPVSSSDGAALLTEDGEPLLTEEGEQLLLEDTLSDDNKDYTASSSSWTGLPTSFELTETRRTALARAISVAEADLEAFGATNAEKAQARAYIIAIRALAEAPEPPGDLIWAIVSRASAVATIASLFIQLAQVFLT